MGRKKNFSRESVLEKAVPVFWAHGFADTSLQDLELATGVNKSGLYAEFKDKEDLFLASLDHYLVGRHRRGLLTAEPLGWQNVERFLKQGYSCGEGPKGCFSVSSMRELSVLPPAAGKIIAAGQAHLKNLLVNNIKMEETRLGAAAIADMVMIFFFGICMEQNMEIGKAATARKIDNFLQAIRAM